MCCAVLKCSTWTRLYSLSVCIWPAVPYLVVVKMCESMFCYYWYRLLVLTECCHMGVCV
jgi:hypothetical protein